MSEEKDESDWVVAKVPQIWKFNVDQMKEQKKRACIKTVQSTNGINANSFNSNPVPVQSVSRLKVARSVQKRPTNDYEATRQFISSKRLQKLLKRGEPVYLAMVRPTAIQKQGITQKVKQQIMKEKGPIKKAPPIVKTRKRMCSEAPIAI